MSNVQTQGVETLQVNLSREHQGVPWGFRLTGGRDFANALAIQLVQPNSVAEVQGLCAGDGVLSINNIPSDELEHEQAKQEIMRSGNNVQFLVQRGGVTIWKPKVTPLSDLRPDQTTLPTGEQVVQRTSLAANQGPVHHIGSAHNRAARPFGGFGGGSGGGSCAPTNTYSGGPSQQQHAQQLHQQQAYAQQQAQQFNNPPPAPPSDAGSAGQGGTVPAMVHAQYNSPMGLYSQTNVADTYQAQAQGLVNKMSGMNVQDGGPSPTAQAVLGGKTPENDPPSPEPSPPPVLPAVIQDEYRREPAKQSAIYEDRADGEEIQYKGYANPHSQSRSFKMLQQELAEVDTGGARTGGTRSVSAPVTRPGAGQKPKEQLNKCGECGMLIAGVFLKIKGIPLHAECFKCAQCGKMLKNIGYFHIEGRNYCELHAKQLTRPGYGGYEANVTYN